MRTAIVTVQEVTVQCPHCDDNLLNDEDSNNHSECVFASAGVVTCAACARTFVVPDLSTAFRRLRAPRKKKEKLEGRKFLT